MAEPLQSVGLKRRREVEEEYSDKRQRKDPQRLTESTQPLKRLNEKNLEELDRQTGLRTLNGINSASKNAGRGEKKRTLSWRSSPTDMDQETASVTSQNSSTLANYRWKNLDYARTFVEDAPLPGIIQSRVDTIIQPQISEARKNELSLITKTLCDAFIVIMGGSHNDDDSVGPIYHALRSMDKGRKFVLLRNADWDPSLKPNVQRKTWHFNILDKPNDTADDSLERPDKRQLVEPAYTSTEHLEPTIPLPLPPLEQEISVVKTPCPEITIGPSLTTLVEKLKARGFGELEARDFLNALQNQQAFRLSPLQPTIPMCFPLMVVEGKSYSTGSPVFEAQNQAAVSGGYMTDMQHNLAKFTESTCHRSHHSKEPLAFSICTEGPMMQLWVHYTTSVDNVRMYQMNILKICHASRLPSLQEGVQEFFEAVDGVMSWAASDLLDEVAEQLVLVSKGTQQGT